ncbi:MAG: MaoC family dehydratase [Rhodothermales bacterium]|nr:MaoC family dehydratase [Rhodothermales bacterium]
MHTYDSLTVGDRYEYRRTLTMDDVRAFADVSGDDNPIHLDPEYAAQHAPGGTPIVHGALLMAVISKMLGRDFPGPGSVAVSLACKFLRPVPVGSEVVFEAQVFEKRERFGHVQMKVYAYLNGKTAMGGDAVLIPPKA